MVFSSNNSDFEVKGSFVSKASFDTAYPNGGYQMSGGSFPTITINLSGELYPAAIPQVIGGTWGNGVLVVNPSQSYLLTINNFTGYASSGVAGHLKLSLSSANGGDNVNLNQETVTRAVAGITVSSTPFTSYVIPANTLRAGLVYQLVLEYDTVTTLDTTSLPGGNIIGMYSSVSVAYIAAQSATSIAPPAITTQPANQTVAQGTNAVLGAVVTFNGSSSPPNNNTVYQWIFNGQQIGGTSKYSQNGGNLTIYNVAASDAGTYFLEVYNGGGLAISQAATLTVSGLTGTPQFTTQPQSQLVNTGANVTFTVVSTGSPAPTYQWQYNGVNIAGATSAMYTVTNVQSGNMGFYSVAASNSAGTVNSDVAILTIAAGSSRLGSLSTRGIAGAGASALTPGISLRGVGNKPLVIRGVGPTLGAPPSSGGFGVPNTLSNPQLQVTPLGGSTLVSNDDWGTNTNLAALRAAMTAVGAFPLIEGSKDAAVLVTTAGNNLYTVPITPSGTATPGIALAEIYDTEGATAAVKLVAVSTRGFTGPDEQVLTPGFFIVGDGPKQLLIRAVGPTLGAAPYNVPGVLADPQFTVISLNNNLPVARNDNWGDTAALQAAFTQTGAFPLLPGSKDGAAIVRLPPGGYTVQATGVGGTTGNVLVEVYDMDP